MQSSGQLSYNHAPPYDPLLSIPLLAQKWYQRLPTNSIHNFKELAYAHLHIPKKLSLDL